MSELTDELRLAQRVLDRCNGDVAEAITYAAFRASVSKALRNHWRGRGVGLVEHGVDCTCADEPEVVRLDVPRRRLRSREVTAVVCQKCDAMIPPEDAEPMHGGLLCRSCFAVEEGVDA